MRIRKDVIKLALPVLTEQVFVMSMGVINAIMAGRIGEEAVSAIGMVDSINMIFITFFSSLAVGATVVVAHYTGQHDIDDANEATKQAIYSGAFLSIITTILIFIFRIPLINVLYGSAEQSVINNSRIYLEITLLTYPLIALTSIACGVLRGAGDTRTPMKITISMNFINVIFSYILIYGINFQNSYFNIHLPGMQVKGAAMGIAIARTIGAIGIMYTLVRGSKIIKLSKLWPVRINMVMQRSIFGIGIPASIESLLFSGGKLVTQVFIVDMGTAVIAANYIANSVASFINIPGGALSIAATTIVGQDMGMGKREEARVDLIYLIKLSMVSLAAICAVILPLARPIASLYTKNQDIMGIAAVLIRLTAISTPLFWSLSFMLPAGLKGAGDAKYTMTTSIIGMWVFRISLGYILGVPLKLGITGVWIAMYIDWIVRGTMYWMRLKGDKWQKNVVIKQEQAIEA